MNFRSRTKQCGNCEQPFQTTPQMKDYCCTGCLYIGHKDAIRAAQDRKASREAKAVRLADKAKLLELKPLSYWEKRAERAVNAFIVQRDYFLPCISCGTTDATWNAGHYISVGANRTLRFNEDNISKQCVRCNQHLSGNAIPYRINLLQKIGAERLGVLEGWHAPRKVTIAECQQIEKIYQEKTKVLKSEGPDSDQLYKPSNHANERAKA